MAFNLIINRLILKETFLYIISKAIPGILGIISVILFIRIVGPSEYGLYSLLLSQCNLIVSIGIGWLNQAQLRYYSKDFKKGYFVYNQIRAFISSMIFCLILISIFLYYQNFSFNFFILSILTIISISAFNYLKTLYQAKLLPGKIILLTSFQSLFCIIIPLILMFYFGYKAKILLLGAGLSFLISLAIVSTNYFRKISYFFIKKNNFNKKNLLKWFSYGSPLSIWFAVGLALPFLDRYFINYFVQSNTLGFQSNTLGVYSSLQEILVRSFSLTLFPFIMVIHPRIMNLWNDSKINEALQLILRSFYLIFSVGLLIIFFVWYFNDSIFLIIKTFIPQIPLNSKILILPLISAGFLWQLSFLTHKMLELKEQTILMIIAIIPSLIINIIGNSYYLPKIGIVATAYTAFYSALFYCIITGIHFFHSINKKLC